MKVPPTAARFLVVALWVTALITSTGAILGAALWPLAGWLAGSTRRPDALVLAGARTLGFYFFLWAPGTGIVIAVMHEWRRRHPRPEPPAGPPSAWTPRPPDGPPRPPPA